MMEWTMSRDALPLGGFQQAALVVLRTLVGWQFVYEGLVKLWAPAWSRAGAPLPPWTAAGYLQAASGPLGDLFHGLAGSRLLPVIDAIMPVALVLVGLSLMLGLFTRLGATFALVLLALFYLSSIPTAGVHQTGAEGAYLLVSKNLIEAAAVLVLLGFDTGKIAGLDLLRGRPAAPDAPAAPQGAGAPS
jgi:thiosulfate dehydrogenase [quinone] large subunit